MKLTNKKIKMEKNIYRPRVRVRGSSNKKLYIPKINF